MNLQHLPHRISGCSTLRIQSQRKFLEPSINLSLFPLFLKPQIAVSHKRLLFPNFSLIRRRRRRGRWRIRWWRLKKLQLFLRRSILGSSVACNCCLSSNLIQLVLDLFFFPRFGLRLDAHHNSILMFRYDRFRWKFLSHVPNFSQPNPLFGWGNSERQWVLLLRNGAFSSPSCDLFDGFGKFGR